MRKQYKYQPERKTGQKPLKSCELKRELREDLATSHFPGSKFKGSSILNEYFLSRQGHRERTEDSFQKI